MSEHANSCEGKSRTGSGNGNGHGHSDPNSCEGKSMQSQAAKGQFSHSELQQFKMLHDLLANTREITAKTTFKSAAKILKGKAAWDLQDDQRRICFDIYISGLKGLRG